MQNNKLFIAIDVYSFSVKRLIQQITFQQQLRCFPYFIFFSNLQEPNGITKILNKILQYGILEGQHSGLTPFYQLSVSCFHLQRPFGPRANEGASPCQTRPYTALSLESQ